MSRFNRLLIANYVEYHYSARRIRVTRDKRVLAYGPRSETGTACWWFAGHADELIEKIRGHIAHKARSA